MVEVSLVCKGVEPGHEFKHSFPDPVNWQEVTMWIKSDDPRCELHPCASDACYWDE